MSVPFNICSEVIRIKQMGVGESTSFSVDLSEINGIGTLTTVAVTCKASTETDGVWIDSGSDLYSATGSTATVATTTLTVSKLSTTGLTAGNYYAFRYTVTGTLVRKIVVVVYVKEL